MGIYTVKNFSQGTLESGISSEDTQLTVNEGSTLPTSGTFVAVIWNPSYLEASKDPNVEIITGILSSERTYDVVRACEGTIASNHADGDRVSLHFTAGLFSDLVGPVGPKGDKGEHGIDGSPGSAHTLSFVNGDLSSGILTVSHGLGFKYVTLQVYNNLDKAIIPDGVTLVDDDTLTIDLSGHLPLSGTWNVNVTAGGGATGPTGGGDVSGPATNTDNYIPQWDGANSKTLKNGIDPTTLGKCTAWVNFNGIGTVAIRASYNVSSIMDNNTGDYTINFTSALSDANYAVIGSCNGVSNTSHQPHFFGSGRSSSDFNTSYIRFINEQGGTYPADREFFLISVFR